MSEKAPDLEFEALGNGIKAKSESNIPEFIAEIIKILLGIPSWILQFPRPPGIRASSPEFHHVSINTPQPQGH